MNIKETFFSDAKILEPKVFSDDRGFFFESYNQKAFSELLGLNDSFVQDNHSRSSQNVLRGLHYQLKNPQGKLVRVTRGEVFDVIVDMRKASPTVGKWFGVHLSEYNKKMLWVPAGFAHGFLVLSTEADFLYKTTHSYDPTSEYCLKWDDPDISIDWPIQSPPLLSKKDQQGALFREIPLF